MPDAVLFCLIYLAALVLFGATGFYVAVVVMIITAASALYFYGPAMISPMAELIWSTSNNYVLTSMPLFVLLGELLLRSGIADRMYIALSAWLGRLPGGLLHTNIGSLRAVRGHLGLVGGHGGDGRHGGAPSLQKRGYSDARRRSASWRPAARSAS